MRRLGLVYIVPFLYNARAFSTASIDDEYNTVLKADIIADRSRTFITALLPDNAPRNRYPSILANEATRVHLSSGIYINANHFRLKDVPISYILTQAPMPHTVAEFWAMMLEQRVKVIVQLNAEDGGYLDDRTPGRCIGQSFFDDSTGKSVSKHITQHNISFRGHTLTHYHYTAWPDLGVPENNSEVLGLVRMVGGSMTPMIVHCKGGVGRTGTL